MTAEFTERNNGRREIHCWPAAWPLRASSTAWASALPRSSTFWIVPSRPIKKLGRYVGYAVGFGGSGGAFTDQCSARLRGDGAGTSAR